MNKLFQGEGSEPVGWQHRLAGSPNERWFECSKEGFDNPTEGIEYRALYASPPPLPAGNADPRVREALERVEHDADNNSDGYTYTIGRDALDALIHALRSALPSPQSQGLVEAAEIAEYEAAKWGITGATVLHEFAKLLRSRASDRSA